MNKYRKFFPLYATNLFGVMNDNVLKSLVCFVAATWVSEEYRSVIVNVIAASMVVPYILFSPLAGKLPHFFSKISVVRVAKICEIPIMAISILGFYFQNLPLAIAGCLLMGFQSALFSPSKYGLIKDIGGTSGISIGMSGMEAFSFLGMLVGTFVGSLMADSASLLYISAVLMALALSGLGCSYTIRAREQEFNEESSSNPVTFIRDTFRIVNRTNGLHNVIIYLSLFWWLSASLQIIIIVHCPAELGMTPSHTGCILAAMALGITSGCLVGGQINHKHYLLGATPLIGLLMSVLLILAYALPFGSMGDAGVFVFAAIMVLVAFLGGMFKIPLDAEIQRKSKPSELNIVLAYFNLLSFVFIFLASLTNIAVTHFAPSGCVFLVDAIILIISSICFVFSYRGVLCFLTSRLLHIHYDVELVHKEVLEAADGQNLLILPMHRALLDPIMLFSELYDTRLQPMVDSRFFRSAPVAHVLSLFDAVQVPDLREGGRAGLEQVRRLDGIVASQLKNGSNIIFYPSGHITMDGKESIGNRRMAYNAVQDLPDTTKVVGVEIHGLWGSAWSNYGKSKTPSLMDLLGKSIKFVLTLKFLKYSKRKVTVAFTDITADVREWKSLPRPQFNKKLEDFYNRREDTLVASCLNS